MKKYFAIGILCLASIYATANLLKKNQANTISMTQFKKFSWRDNFSFSQIPILHSGRIKPLSTLAREYLLVLYEKSSLPNMSADQWLAETLFDPPSSSKRLLFKIRNPEIIDVLNIKSNAHHTYSFNKLSKSLDTMMDLLNKIKNKPKAAQSHFEKQLFNLYVKVLSYFQLQQSLSLIQPLFKLESSTFSKEIGMVPNKHYSYLEMVKFQQKLIQKSKQLKKEHFKNLSKAEQELILLSYKINILSKNSDNHLFKIIPPQWSDNKELWYSPWAIIGHGKGSPLSASYLNSWINMEKAYRTGKNWKMATQSAYNNAINISKNFSNPILLYMEKISNDIQFFQKSLLLYLLAFLCALCSFIFLQKMFFKAAWTALICGFLLHLIGIIFHIIIMGRPPVSNLYESVIFVGLIAVGLTLLLEKYNLKESIRNGESLQPGVSLLLGSLVGATLHFIGLKYKGAESMSLLVPVLNTNFWLATHVTCITIGYGCAIVTSLMGHTYIVIQCLNHQKKSSLIDLSDFYKKIQFLSFVALFFCLFGTILGGIWADQSWGRFWGWDPKENGALAIVIWLLVLIHGKLSGILKEDGYAIGMIFTNIVVALSWFGVNLLNVGLHSYGFINGVFWGLIIFCGFEFLFASSSYIYLQKK